MQPAHPPRAPSRPPALRPARFGPAPPMSAPGALDAALARAFERTHPAAGLHLMDATMAWGPCHGVQRVINAKHDRLGEHGWQHTVLAPGVHGPGRIDCGGVRLPGLGGQRVLLHRRHAESLIEQARPDIVEAADPYLLSWAVLAATERLGVPAVAFCHNHLPALAARWLGGADGLLTRRGRWAARRARNYLVRLYGRFDLVLAPSRALTERLRDWGLPQATHQPLGVDCSVFNPAAADPPWRQRLCQRLGLDAGTRLLVYSGRFAPDKKLDLLAEAVRVLGPGHALLAIGAGPAPPGGPQVRLWPPETDSAQLARLVASADAYVHAGDQETFGLGVLEAMACGTPVVVSAAGGLGEMAQDVGTLVQRQRPQEWAEAISASLQTGRSGLTRAALEKAHAHDWGWVIDRLSRRYLRLVSRNRQPAAWAGAGTGPASFTPAAPASAAPKTVPGQAPPRAQADRPTPSAPPPLL